jgi:uncharacterized protein DUF5309
MAGPTNAWTSYGLGWPGQTNAATREDLSDLVAILSPEDTPAVTMLPKTTTQGLLHEWMTDVLSATSTAGIDEGADFVASALSGRTRYSNVVQIFRKDIMVSNDEQQLAANGKTVGVSNEYDYQIGKALKEIKRNIDARIWANGSATVASVTGTTAIVRRMAAVRGWSASAILTDVSGGFATGSFLALHEAMYSEGADPDTLFVSPGVKSDISRTLLNDGSLARVQFQDPLAKNTYAPIVDVIQTDFGRLAVVPDRWIPQSGATAASASAGQGGAYFLIEKSKLRLAFFRPAKHFPLPPSGDSVRGFCLAALTLEVLHPSAIGIGHNVST